MILSENRHQLSWIMLRRSLDAFDSGRVPHAGQRFRLRRIETHGEVERAFRRGQPVGFAIAAGIFILEVER
jgi:hypothetical protein